MSGLDGGRDPRSTVGIDTVPAVHPAAHPTKRSPAESNASLLVTSGRWNMNATRPSGRYRHTVISPVPSLGRLPTRKNPPKREVGS